MGAIHKNHDAVFKAKVALEAVKSEKTIAQLSSEYGVHLAGVAPPIQIGLWRNTNHFSGSISNLIYHGNDTARVVVGTQNVPVDWIRHGVSANIRYRLLDLYGAWIWDTLKGLPESSSTTFDNKAKGFTLAGDYLMTNQILLSIRYDQMDSGGIIAEKSDGKVLTAQARYYLRDNFSFYLRDSYNMETASKNPLQNFSHLFALGIDFVF